MVLRSPICTSTPARPTPAKTCSTSTFSDSERKGSRINTCHLTTFSNPEREGSRINTCYTSSSSTPVSKCLGIDITHGPSSPTSLRLTSRVNTQKTSTSTGPIHTIPKMPTPAAPVSTLKRTSYISSPSPAKNLNKSAGSKQLQNNSICFKKTPPPDYYIASPYQSSSSGLHKTQRNGNGPNNSSSTYSSLTQQQKQEAYDTAIAGFQINRNAGVLKWDPTDIVRLLLAPHKMSEFSLYNFLVNKLFVMIEEEAQQNGIPVCTCVTWKFNSS